ncbi:nucleoside hydrolase, partial [Candidatus Bathyarchaeota archaeon]|nr:nucleoside hydrolase [Candidatus Bathyarchaeota archaeon]
MLNVIFDTDIGDDIDDALALLLALKSPEINVKAVSTVCGDVETRAMLTLRIMEEMGVRDIPVKPGVSKPLLESRPTDKPNQAVALEGWESRLLDRWRSYGMSVADFITSFIEESKGETVIVSVGPLTNIALALASNPWIVDKARLVMMGGCFSRQVAEYNIRRDPEAAGIVFESGIPLTMVGLDVTLKCIMNDKQVEAFKSSKLQEVRFVSKMMDAWMHCTKSRNPILHDPLAVAVSFTESFVTVKPMRISMEVRGEYTRGFTVP